MANFPLMFRMVTSSAPHRPASVLDRADAVPRAGPVVLSHALLRERPDAYRRRRLRLHLLAAPGLRRGFNPAPPRRAQGDLRVLPAAEPRVGPRRRARSEAPAATDGIPRCGGGPRGG